MCMRSMAAVTVILATTFLPVWAQRGASHGSFGGFAGHAPAWHGGMSSGGSFSTPGRTFATRPPAGFNRYPGANLAFRGGFNRFPSSRWPYRRFVRGPFLGTVWPGFYSYPFYPYWGFSDLFDGGDDPAQDPNSGPAPAPDYGPGPDGPGPYPDYGYGAAPGGAYPGYGYGGGYPEYGYGAVPPGNGGPGMAWMPAPPDSAQMLPRAPYTGTSQQPAAPQTEEAVTLIFRDGRTSEQIRNYMLSRTTLTVLDQPFRQIPLDQIDVAATVEKNREAGIDFRVPSTSH
jgi:hypothetical protein